MKRVASTISPVISVDRRSTTPLHRQVYDAYRSAILRRHLLPGQQIPSSRALAAELGVSRIPVLSAYSQLLAEGYFQARTGSGTYISDSLPEQMTTCELRASPAARTANGFRRLARRCETLRGFKAAPWLYGWGAFSVGQVSLDAFPFQVWLRLVARHCARLSTGAFHFSDPLGSENFRETIAKYLRTARAVNCEPNQIMVVSGSQQALEIAARVLLNPGDAVWLEEPGYTLARQVFALAGCRIVPVPVDDEGLDVSLGIKRSRKARAAYVTPSHQFPLGTTMSASRRLQLLEWAERSDAWIIEDDYDSEYRYTDLPIASLQGLDRSSRVIYIGTFSKTLFPSLRLGFMVIPPDLIEKFVTVRHIMDIYPPHLYQAVLKDFVEEGHFARHVRRTRLLYAEKRRVLVEALKEQFGDSVQIHGASAGLHQAATLSSVSSDRAVSFRAAKQKLWLWPLSPCYLGDKRRQGFVLGFGSAPTNAIRPAVQRFRKLID